MAEEPRSSDSSESSLPVRIIDTEVVSVEKGRYTSPENVVEERRRLVRQYHGGAEGLLERLKKDKGRDGTLDELVIKLVDEVIAETDNLLGNELVATKEGQLAAASTISFKRAEVLEKAIKAVQTKQEFERERGIDVDSPGMRVIFKFFMTKAQGALQKMNYGEDANNLFFRNLFEELKEWQKELKVELSQVGAASKEP